MQLHGKRWVFLIGNSVVKVDNAFSWTLWTQERLLVNEEAAQESAGWGRIFQRYREPWLTPLGERELSLTLRSSRAGIACIALLDGEKVEPAEVLETSWRGGARSWPSDGEWKPAAPFGLAG